MACKTCGQSGSSFTQKQGCKNCSTDSSIVPCNQPWMLPVVTLPSPETASRKYIYVLPSEQYFVLNYDGDGWNELKNEGTYAGNYYVIGDLLENDETISGSKWKIVYKKDIIQELIISLDSTVSISGISTHSWVFKYDCMLQHLTSIGYQFDMANLPATIQMQSIPVIVKQTSSSGLITYSQHLILFKLGSTGNNVTLEIINWNSLPTIVGTPEISLIANLTFNFIGYNNSEVTDQVT